MGIPHKALNFKRLLGIVLLCTLVLGVKTAQAQENPLFTVEGVTVDETAESSVAAQQKAFEQAQLKAYEVLAQRMVESTGAVKPKTPDVVTISTMIKDFEVTNEQVSAVRYVGTYTFRFRESDVQSLFSVASVPNMPVTATANGGSPQLVLPYFQKDGKNTIWSDYNLWLAAWSRAVFAEGSPVEVPIGDLMDVGDISDAQGLNYNTSRLSEMQSRYGATASAILVATPDAALGRVPAEADKAVGYLEIDFYRTDLGAAQFVQQISVKADGTESRAQLYDRAVQMAYQKLQGDWKSTPNVPGGKSQGYVVRIAIQGLKDWVRIQMLLRSVPGMSDIDVESVSPREARASLNFRGDEMALRNALSNTGMSLGQGIPDGAGVAFYDLQVDVAPTGDNFYQPPAAEIQEVPHMRDTSDFYQGPEGAEPAVDGEQDGNMVHTF